MQLKVAVLEDDEVFRDEILVPELSDHGFDVEAFGASSALYRRMLAKTFDAVILDIGLPGENGFHVARHLRENSSMGIVTLTGRSCTAERVKGLTEGCDAWLVKPVETEIISATLFSLMRRIKGTKADIRPSEWRLNDSNWRLQAPNNRETLLNTMERRVLMRLFSKRGEQVSRAELIADLAREGEDFDPHRLDMLVYRLRQKVKAEVEMTLPIRSVRGCGYVFLNSDERIRSA
jgi:DNA-binding response OmpR family regulator